MDSGFVPRWPTTVPVFPSSWSAQRVTCGTTARSKRSWRIRTRLPSASSRASAWPGRSRLSATWSAPPSTRTASRRCSPRPWGPTWTHSPPSPRSPASCSKTGPYWTEPLHLRDCSKIKTIFKIFKCASFYSWLGMTFADKLENDPLCDSVLTFDPTAEP